MVARSHNGGGLERSRRETPGRRALSRQGGSVGPMFAAGLIVMVGFCGLAIDLSMKYNRKAELQTVSDAVALAAAKELNGTQNGIDAALARAAEVAGELKYSYWKKRVEWKPEALEFGSSPALEGAWKSAADAKGQANKIFFAKVDTSKLDSEHGFVENIFMQALDATASTEASSASVAGRNELSVTPIAICALDDAAAKARVNPGPPQLEELVEYGFRRGVAYDLMRLNPNDSTPENFIVNPVDKVGALGMQSNSDASVVAPYVCTGSIRATGIVGSSITVRRPFPINSLFNHLNSRFDQYPGGSCSPASAPPDANIKPFTYTSINWMSTAPGEAPGGQSAAERQVAGAKLWTVADEAPVAPGITAPMYGPLWSYARGVPFAIYQPGQPEPSGGYPPFATAAWNVLYPPLAMPTASYPVATPYGALIGANFLAPAVAHRPGVRHRRVLNVPLLQCPVAAGVNVTANVLGIGKFFMTVPATSTSLVAEFAGIVPEAQLVKSVELF